MWTETPPSNTKDNTCCYIYLLPQRRQLLTVLYAKTTKWKHLNLAYKHWFYISIYNDSNKSNLHKNHTGLSFFFFFSELAAQPCEHIFQLYDICNFWNEITQYTLTKPATWKHTACERSIPILFVPGLCLEE